MRLKDLFAVFDEPHRERSGRLGESPAAKLLNQIIGRATGSPLQKLKFVVSNFRERHISTCKGL